MNSAPWQREPKSCILLRTSHLSPVASPLCQQRAKQHTDAGLVLCTGVNLISFHDLEASHKKHKREGEHFQQERCEPPACLHTVSHNPAYHIRGGRPEHVIPKAQGHLMGRAPSQEQPCTKQSPWYRHQERGIFEDQEWWEERGCWGWGRSVSQSQSFAANCQAEWSAHAPHELAGSVNALTGCTQTWQERVKHELNRRKPSATGISVSFKAVSVLRTAWALERHSTCSFWSPSYHPTSLAQTAEQHLVTNT